MFYNLKMPYSPQGKKSANCGPCSLKMAADFYRIKHIKKRQAYSVPSLNRICNVSKQWGTDFKDLNKAIRKIGLEREKISTSRITSTLKSGRPIITVFMDEEGGGHYALIKGIKREGSKKYLIFHDPYWGKNFKREWKTFLGQAKRFNHWMYALSPAA